MKTRNRKNHDALTKIFLTQDISVARDFLSIYLPKEILNKCDLDSIKIEPTSYIEDDLRTLYSDIVYKADIKSNHKINSAYFYILVEHQSKAELLMPFRIIKYQLAIIQKHLEQNSAKKEIAKLPLVVPLVFYNGKRSPYPYPCNISSLFSEPDLYKEIPLGTFNLIDLTIKDNDELLKHKKIALMEVIEKHIHARDILAFAKEIAMAFQVGYNYDISTSLVNASLSYLYEALDPEDLQGLIRKIIEHTPFYEDTVMSYADQLRAEGMKEGIKEGKYEERQSIAKKLLKAGIDEKLVATTTSLSTDQIAILKKDIH